MGGGGVSEFLSCQVTKFSSFQVSKGGREGGRTNERPGTDHVISGPMRGLGKNCTDGADRQTDRHPDRRTWRLYDQLGPEGPSWWKIWQRRIWLFLKVHFCTKSCCLTPHTSVAVGQWTWLYILQWNRFTGGSKYPNDNCVLSYNRRKKLLKYHIFIFASLLLIPSRGPREHFVVVFSATTTYLQYISITNITLLLHIFVSPLNKKCCHILVISTTIYKTVTNCL